jgi:hypothetical protein
MELLAEMRRKSVMAYAERSGEDLVSAAWFFRLAFSAPASTRSGGAVVLVDQSVQELPATDRPVALRRIGLGRPQSESQMGTLAVVVLGVSIKDSSGGGGMQGSTETLTQISNKGHVRAPPRWGPHSYRGGKQCPG